jgi:hypothetical protein
MREPVYSNSYPYNCASNVQDPAPSRGVNQVSEKQAEANKHAPSLVSLHPHVDDQIGGVGAENGRPCK